MTVTHYGNQLYKGLSTDAKPIASQTAVNAIFEETDTGDSLVSDGTYWWLTNQPTSLSNRRSGGIATSTSATAGYGMINAVLASTGIGTTAFVNTDITNGRYYSIPSLATLGNRGGYRYNGATLLARIQNPRLRVKFSLPAASDYALSRLYIGMSANQEHTGDDPINALNGFMVGFISGATNFKVLHNDGVGATVFDDVAATAKALDTAVHDVKIVADNANSRFSVKWDNNPYVHFTTEIPAQTTNITLVYQNETNENAAKTWRLYTLRLETDG